MQYDESDLRFIQRLCEEEGIHYHFEHRPKGHVLVFGDDQTGFPKLGQPTAYVQDTGLVADESGDQALRPAPGHPHQPGHPPRLRLRATTPAAGNRHQGRFQPNLEDYDYPGRFTERARGKHLPNARWSATAPTTG